MKVPFTPLDWKEYPKSITPFFRACLLGQPDLVRELLMRNPGDINKADRIGVRMSLHKLHPSADRSPPEDPFGSCL
jgi:hypothetical protein